MSPNSQITVVWSISVLENLVGINSDQLLSRIFFVHLQGSFSGLSELNFSWWHTKTCTTTVLHVHCESIPSTVPVCICFHHKTLQDLLHPLTTFEWKESKKLEVRDPTLCTRAVYLNGYIYIGISACFSAIHGKVYALSTDLTTWNAVTPTKREGFALTTFQSKLVLVGGKCETTKELYNTLLTSSDGTEWQDKTLPPMSAGRSEALAFSVGENEYLIVAGGVDSSNRPVNTVEVLVGQRWFSLSPLPRPCCQVRVTFHCGNVYLFGGPGSYYCQVFCRLAALKKACIEAKKNNTDKTLWEQFPSVDRIHSPVSFRGQLIDMGRRRSSKICAYNPFTRTWVHVEDLPIRYSASTAVVTSAGELVVIGRSSFTAKAFKATMTSKKIIRFFTFSALV